MARRAGDQTNRIYVWSHSELSSRQPRLEWVNQPSRWAEDLARSLPWIPPGPNVDLSELSDVGTGLPVLETPRLVVDRSIGSKPLFDVIGHSRSTFLASERAMSLFKTIDPDAFVFLECETILSNGDAGPRYWLCDLVRKLDAFDFERSDGARITQREPALRFMISPYYDRNVFRKAVVGNAHFFRLKNNPSRIYCDETARAAINAVPKLKGITCVGVGALDG